MPPKPTVTGIILRHVLTGNDSDHISPSQSSRAQELFDASSHIKASPGENPASLNTIWARQLNFMA
jgi:hypothetical protein